MFDKLRIEQLGRGCFIREEPEQTDIRMAREGLDKCAALMAGGDYDVVILDELTIALHYGLLTVREVLEALDRRHPVRRDRHHGPLRPAGTDRPGRPGNRNARNKTLLPAGRTLARRDRQIATPHARKNDFQIENNAATRKRSRAGILLLDLLHLDQPGIDAVPFHQLLVSPLFGDPALFDHDDPVGVVDRAQTVGDHQRSAPFQ